MPRKTIIFTALFLLIPFVSASTEIAVNPTNRPSSAILLIVDGLGSSYFYPELVPEALDGSILKKASAPNLTMGSVRIVDVRAVQPITGIGHSVIVTGDSKADEEVVGYPDATIYDTARKYGFLALAVMEKGDFINMRREQDLILYAKTTSFPNPEISLESKETAPSDVYQLMAAWQERLPSYLARKKGVDQYIACNQWGIDASKEVVVQMIENHPNQRFILTINLGAVDSAGHNMGHDDYIKTIEALDAALYPLYMTAVENNLAFILTADHGMSFASPNAQKGGHLSKEYLKKIESLRIPLIITSPNAQAQVLDRAGQEEIAPTILSILDLPNNLQYADGKAANIKNYANLHIKAPSSQEVGVWSGEYLVAPTSRDTEFFFSGLKTGVNYTIKAKGDYAQEEKVYLDSDKTLELQAKLREDVPVFSSRAIIAVILIFLVNIIGFLIIKRIKD